MGTGLRPPRCSTRHCSSPLFSPAWVAGAPVRWGSRHHDALDVATAAAAISGLAHRVSRGSLALGRGSGGLLLRVPLLPTLDSMGHLQRPHVLHTFSRPDARPE